MSYKHLKLEEGYVIVHVKPDTDYTFFIKTEISC